MFHFTENLVSQLRCAVKVKYTLDFEEQKNNNVKSFINNILLDWLHVEMTIFEIYWAKEGILQLILPVLFFTL